MLPHGSPSFGGLSRCAPAHPARRVPHLPLLIGLMLGAAGCIRHEVHLVPAPQPVQVEHAGEFRFGGSSASGPLIVRSPMPLAGAVDHWWRDADGVLWRDATRIATDRPLWQRFPLDLIVDILPIDAVVAATVATQPRRVESPSPAELTAAARVAGYATP